jgi:inorganic pyrophosphatase
MRTGLGYLSLVIGGIGVGLGIAWYSGQPSPGKAAPIEPQQVALLDLGNGPIPHAPGTQQIDPLTLRGEKNWYSDYPTRNADGTFNMVVEIPTGTNAKWEVDASGDMTLEIRDGAPRLVKYMPYPGNYGIIPGTKLAKDQGGDGDALDILVVAPALPRGSVVPVRVIGVLKCLDRGEQDDKVLAVMANTPLESVHSLAEMNKQFPGVTEIVRLWFTHYKGPGKMEIQGWGEADEALALVEQAAKSHEASAAGR